LKAGMYKPGTALLETHEDGSITRTPVIPANDSEEDAAMRREMLDYAQRDINSVVAELELEEGSDFSYEEDIDDVDTDDGDYEDQYGMSLRPQISSTYREEMLDLERKLEAKVMENVGPRPPEELNADLAKDVRRLVVQPDAPYANGDFDAAKSKPGKKGVRFAEDLDISPAPTPPPSKPASTPSIADKPTKAPMAEAVVERSTTPATTAPEPTPTKKVSRFKKMHTPANADPTAPPTMGPSGPRLGANVPLSSALVERPAIQRDPPSAPEEGDFDDELLQRELATEYHAARNRFIQKQGGFKPSLEEEAEPLMEEVDGKVRKVSRFRAARLGREAV
ncbi:hypothetical protein LTS18_002105, partial [Coniosporium uncinatum]